MSAYNSANPNGLFRRSCADPSCTGCKYCANQVLQVSNASSHQAGCDCQACSSSCSSSSSSSACSSSSSSGCCGSDSCGCKSSSSSSSCSSSSSSSSSSSCRPCGSKVVTMTEMIVEDGVWKVPDRIVNGKLRIVMTGGGGAGGNGARFIPEINYRAVGTGGGGGGSGYMQVVEMCNVKAGKCVQVVVGRGGKANCLRGGEAGGDTCVKYGKKQFRASGGLPGQNGTLLIVDNPSNAGIDVLGGRGGNGEFGGSGAGSFNLTTGTNANFPSNRGMGNTANCNASLMCGQDGYVTIRNPSSTTVPVVPPDGGPGTASNNVGGQGVVTLLQAASVTNPSLRPSTTVSGPVVATASTAYGPNGTYVTNGTAVTIFNVRYSFGGSTNQNMSSLNRVVQIPGVIESPELFYGFSGGGASALPGGRNGGNAGEDGLDALDVTLCGFAGCGGSGAGCGASTFFGQKIQTKGGNGARGSVVFSWEECVG